ncbi:MAG TPA: ATP-dependent DNA helicase RecG [Candidatus Saccharimonadales bacterium]|nr:ATP-dependent DNA helicase RecG [Candidatus Saccharimonadales bacterium]
MTHNSPVSELKGVGEAQAKRFAVLGVKTVSDLIDYYPRRYDDYSSVTAVSKLKPGPVTIQAVIKQAKGRRVRGGLHITEAVASDASGSVRLVWFNQPYRAAALKSGQDYFISGEYQLSYRRLTIMNPRVEAVSEFPVNTARILAVYRETKDLSSRQIRQAVKQVLPLIAKLPETLPAGLVKAHKLLSRAEALSALHFPADSEQLEAARRRLGFEEVFQLSLASLLNKRENHSEHARKIPYKEQLAVEFSKSLSFKLTDGQRVAVMRIYKDLEKGEPMNRLLEGDVGSGKTVVAAMAALMAIAQGWQVAFMAPTELLARQHAETIYSLLETLGYEGAVGLLVGSLSSDQKTKARLAISSGKTQFIIGTQALIQEKVDMHKLALIVVDEQHRFGVEQRKALMAKAGRMPHVLSLTATPIPRSLALTVYGELDVSVLPEKPAGRQPVVTELVSPNSRAQLYKKIDKQLAAGRQMFVVCPVISESETLDAQSVEQVYERISRHDFKHRRVGLLHGQQKPADKQKIMRQFVENKLDILVSTTVIEVGVDVPNATVMLIESPERFGLAQLHQLRGRVGRSGQQAYCYLVLSDSRPPSRRLRALTSSNDGFKLAELDLEIRGPGAIYGTAQHGALDLRIAKLSDTRLIAEARGAAASCLEDNINLLKYKELMKTVMRLRTVTNLN